MRAPKDGKGRVVKGYRPTGLERAGFSSAWRLDPARYDAAVAEAQRKADATGLDVGLFPCDLTQSWSTRFLPAKAYRTGDDTTMSDGHHCMVVTPNALPYPPGFPAPRV